MNNNLRLKLVNNDNNDIRLKSKLNELSYNYHKDQKYKLFALI